MIMEQNVNGYLTVVEPVDQAMRRHKTWAATGERLQGRMLLPWPAHSTYHTCQ